MSASQHDSETEFSMAYKDPYSVLGLNPGATLEQIKAAYHELAKKYHPDQYSDANARELAEDKMTEINSAYDELTQGNVYTNSNAGNSSNNPWGQNRGPWQQNPYSQNQGPFYRQKNNDNCCQTMACLCCADNCCECIGGDIVPCC